MFKAFTNALSNSWKAFKQTIRVEASDENYRGVGVYGLGDAFNEWTSGSFNELVEAAVSNPIARRSIDFVADNMASVPLKLVEVGEDGETEQVGEHPVLDLLSRPGGPDNLRYTREWLFSGMVWSLMGGGEYWLRGVSPDNGVNEGVPRRLQLFDRSEFVRFIYDNNRIIEGYRLSMDRAGRHGVPVTGDTSEILHSFLYNPKRKERGLPILLSVMRQLDLMEDADSWNKTIAENRGNVPGFMVPTGLDATEQLTREQVEQAQERLNEEMSSARSGNQWKVLSGAYEPKERGITPQEASFIESSQYFGRLVSTGIGVDPSLVGDNSAQTYDNYRTALWVAFTTRILPLLDFNLSSLNRWLMPKFEEEGQTLRLTYDPLEIDAVTEMLLAKVESLTEATQSPILTPNEARQLIEFDELEGEAMDELLLKIGKQRHTNLDASGLSVRSTEKTGGDGAPPQSSKAEQEMIRLLSEGPNVDEHRANGDRI